MASPANNSAFHRLVDRLTRLPGIGQRSAQRIAFHLLKSSDDEANQLAHAIRQFKADLKVCSICGNVSESDPCPICTDPKRDQSVVLIVEQPTDVAAFEQLGMYRGLYHVLMGRLAPLEGLGPGELNITPLLHRIESGQINEVVVGTNPTLEGDGTAMYLAEQLQPSGVKVTRLARGLPSGSHLGGVSKAVLADALHERHGMADE